MKLPELFLNQMRELLGAEYEAFEKSLAFPGYRGLRVNTSKTDTEAFQAAAPFPLERIPWIPNGFYLEEEAKASLHPWYAAGLYYLQEPSAMTPASCLPVEEGDRVLDLCAAPGGKSTQIAGRMQGKGLLVSNEIHPQRARILSENVERLGIRNCLVLNETPQRLAEVFPGYFDRVLVDAPCSGEGMFRKNENAGEEWSPENVEQCAARQDGILDCAVAMLRPGGRLVYSTCTFAPQEDEGSVSRLLRRHPEMKILDPAQCLAGSGRAEAAGSGESHAAQRAEAAGSGESHAAQRADDPGVRERMNVWGFASGRADWIEDEEAPVSGIENTLRLWPHRLRGEGHYLAALQKGGIQTAGEVRSLYGTERGIPEKDCREYLAFAADTLTGKPEGIYLRFGEQLYLAPGDMPALKGLHVLRPGLHLGTLKKNRFEPSHALALALSPKEARRCCPVDGPKAQEGHTAAETYLKGQTFPFAGEKGWYLITVDGYSLGWGKLAGGIMKNHYPKGLRKI